jgi:Transcription factor WhiB
MTPLTRSWRDLALCRQVVTADYDPFFSDDPEDQDDALAVCAVCPAQGACLAYAIRTAQPHGIWGGRPQAELQRLIASDRAGRSRRGLIAAPAHHNAAKTRCRRGHPFDAANTYYDAAGKRRCRACLRAAWHRWKAERRPPTHRTPDGGGLDA